MTATWMNFAINDVNRSETDRKTGLSGQTQAASVFLNNLHWNLDL